MSKDQLTLSLQEDELVSKETPNLLNHPITPTSGDGFIILAQSAGQDEPQEASDLTFVAGCCRSGQRSKHGRFIWKLPDGTEVLRLERDGSFIVRGERVAYNKDIYEAVSEWVASMKT